MNDPAQPATPQPQAPTSGLAIASLICGILGFCCGLISIAGIICGHLSLSQIKKSNGTIGGLGIAKAGTIVSWVSLALNVVLTGIYLLMMPALMEQQRQQDEEMNRIFEKINEKLEEAQQEQDGEARIYRAPATPWV